jgi:hypothetical protein
MPKILDDRVKALMRKLATVEVDAVGLEQVPLLLLREVLLHHV